MQEKPSSSLLNRRYLVYSQKNKKRRSLNSLNTSKVSDRDKNFLQQQYFLKNGQPKPYNKRNRTQYHNDNSLDPFHYNQMKVTKQDQKRRITFTEWRSQNNRSDLLKKLVYKSKKSQKKTYMLDLKRKFYQSKGTDNDLFVQMSRNPNAYLPVKSFTRKRQSYNDIVQSDQEDINRNMQSQPPLMQNRNLREYYGRLSESKQALMAKERKFNCFTPHITYRQLKRQKTTTFPKKWLLSQKRGSQRVQMKDIMPHVTPKNKKSRQLKVNQYVQDFMQDDKMQAFHGVLNNFLGRLVRKQKQPKWFQPKYFSRKNNLRSNTNRKCKQNQTKKYNFMKTPTKKKVNIANWILEQSQNKRNMYQQYEL